MAYGNWIINVTDTITEYGYDPVDLSEGSHKPIHVSCENCGIRAIKEKRCSQRKHLCPTTIDDKKHCFKCKEWKKLEEFSKNRHVFGGYSKLCKECFSIEPSVRKGYKQKASKLKLDLETYLKYRVGNLRGSIKSKKRGTEITIVGQDLVELYNLQKGKCFYSGIEIIHSPGIHAYNSISVDRLDPNKGYTKENIVLCAFAINSFKGGLNEQEFKELIKQIIPALEQYSKN